MLQIPRITSKFISEGFNNTIDQIALFEPDIALNFHYPDCVLFALLIELKNPKHILDLGSYFGMLPLLTEHLHALYGDNKKFNWTLVDNCSYVKELTNFIKGDVKFSGRFLKQFHVDTWNIKNVKPWKQQMFEIHGEYCVPPSTPEEFATFWEKFTSYYKIGNPYKEMYNSLTSIPSQRKFDLVMFDLAAESFEENLEIFQDLLDNYITDDAIIVMDDIYPKHPRGMALFQWIIDNTDFIPLAFSTNKIAIQQKQFKNEFMFTTVMNAGLRANGSFTHAIPQEHFNFFFHKAYKWGDFLNLRAN
jgi:hypothetical protein